MCTFQTQVQDIYGEKKDYACRHQDKKYVYVDNLCIFHHPDVKAKEEKFEGKLQEYLQEIENSDANFYDFIGWIFPEVRFDNYEFKKRIDFSNAKFLSFVDFREMKIEFSINFNGAYFSNIANFKSSIFSSEVYFNNVEFLSEANFYDVEFESYADFNYADFCLLANFNHAKFSKRVYFYHAKFFFEVDFRNVQFLSEVNFYHAKFFFKVDFSNVQFLSMVNFSLSEFEYIASFEGVNFSSYVNFSSVKFSGNVNLGNTVFKENVVIEKCDFYYSLTLNQTIFHTAIKWNNIFIAKLKISQVELKMGGIIRNSTFLSLDYKGIKGEGLQLVYCKPLGEPNTYIEQKEEEEKNKPVIKVPKVKQWNFEGQDLSLLSFVECDLSFANFMSADIQNSYFNACSFAKEKKKIKLFNHNTIYDNYNPNDESSKMNLEKPRNVYQRFKHHFTLRMAHNQAAQFHYQEMRIRQLLSRKGSFNRLFLWFYHFISDYSTNFIKPLVIFIGFVGLYPIFIRIPGWFNGEFLYPQSFKYLLTALLPKSFITAMSINDNSVYTLLENFDYCISSNWYFYIGSLLILYYIIFFTLTSMFIRALS